MRFVLISLILVILGIGILSLLPPRSGMELPTNDKVGHFVAYTVLTVNAGLLVERRKWIVLFATCILYGMLLELLQGLVPGRQVSVLDVLANSTGVLIGWLILQGFKKPILRLLEWMRLG